MGLDGDWILNHGPPSNHVNWAIHHETGYYMIDLVICKVDYARHHSVITWKLDMQDWDPVRHESISKSRKKWLRCLWFLKLYPFQLAYTVFWGIPYNWKMKKQKLKPGLQMALHDMQAFLLENSCSTLSALSGVSLNKSGKVPNCSLCYTCKVAR